MNDIRTIKETFTNMICEYRLKIKHRSETTNLFVSVIEYKPQN